MAAAGEKWPAAAAASSATTAERRHTQHWCITSVPSHLTARPPLLPSPLPPPPAGGGRNERGADAPALMISGTIVDQRRRRLRADDGGLLALRRAHEGEARGRRRRVVRRSRPAPYSTPFRCPRRHTPTPPLPPPCLASSIDRSPSLSASTARSGRSRCAAAAAAAAAAACLLPPVLQLLRGHTHPGLGNRHSPYSPRMLDSGLVARSSYLTAPSPPSRCAPSSRACTRPRRTLFVFCYPNAGLPNAMGGYGAYA